LASLVPDAGRAGRHRPAHVAGAGRPLDAGADGPATRTAAFTTWPAPSRSCRACCRPTPPPPERSGRPARTATRALRNVRLLTHRCNGRATAGAATDGD